MEEGERQHWNKNTIIMNSEARVLREEAEKRHSHQKMLKIENVCINAERLFCSNEIFFLRCLWNRRNFIFVSPKANSHKIFVSKWILFSSFSVEMTCYQGNNKHKRSWVSTKMFETKATLASTTQTFFIRKISKKLFIEIKFVLKEAWKEHLSRGNLLLDK